MNKKLKVIFTILLVIMCICVNLNSIVYSANPNILNEKIVDPDGDTIRTKLNTILGIIQSVGTLFAVGTLMVLGVRYMMGSVEEKAAYKKTMLPYVIGAIFVFSAVTIANVVYKVSQGL